MQQLLVAVDYCHRLGIALYNLRVCVCVCQHQHRRKCPHAQRVASRPNPQHSAWRRQQSWGDTWQAACCSAAAVAARASSCGLEMVTARDWQNYRTMSRLVRVQLDNVLVSDHPQTPVVRLCDFGTSFSAPNEEGEEVQDAPAAPFLPYLGPEFICNDRVRSSRESAAASLLCGGVTHASGMLSRCRIRAWSSVRTSTKQACNQISVLARVSTITRVAFRHYGFLLRCNCVVFVAGAGHGSRRVQLRRHPLRAAVRRKVTLRRNPRLSQFTTVLLLLTCSIACAPRVHSLLPSGRECPCTSPDPCLHRFARLHFGLRPVC